MFASMTANFQHSHRSGGPIGAPITYGQSNPPDGHDQATQQGNVQHYPALGQLQESGYDMTPVYVPGEPYYAVPAYPASYPIQQPGIGLAVAALTTGILGLGVSLVLGAFGIVADAVAVTLGGVALNNAYNGTGDGKGMAIAGLVTGSIGLLVSITCFGIWLSTL